MDLKLACADFSFPLVGHDDSLAIISRLGFAGVDIGVFGGRSHAQPENIFGNLPSAARELADRVRSHGLEFADIFLIPAPDFKTYAANHPDRTQRQISREMFQRGLELTARVNARHMSALPGVAWEGESADDSMKRCADELAWRVEQAKALNIVFSVEAHIGSIAPTPADAMRMVNLAPGLTLTLDYGHFTYRGISDDEIEPLVAKASHFHARCACKGRLQSPLKENTIDYPRVLRAMRKANYPGYIGVEYVWIDWERCNEVDNLCETVLLRDVLLKAGRTL